MVQEESSARNPVSSDKSTTDVFGFEKTETVSANLNDSSKKWGLQFIEKKHIPTQNTQIEQVSRPQNTLSIEQEALLAIVNGILQNLFSR